MSPICDNNLKKSVCPISKSTCPGVCIYADVMENVSVGIIIFDIKNKRIEFQNKYVFDIFKDIKKENDYNNLYTLLVPNINIIDSHLPFITTPINYNNKIIGHTTYKISDSFILTLVRDITEKERLESIASAINMMNNFGYIFSGIRHEIGNPLNSIKMTMSVLRKKLDEFSKKNIENYIDRVQSEINRIEYLLKSLKNFNMYENPDIKTVNINKFLEEFLSLVKTDLDRNNISNKVIYNSNAVYGLIDPRALQQVLINIITNSIDSLQETEQPEIIIEIRDENERILISIMDNGCGIPSDIQKDIFKPFITTKEQGTGLGLVIVKKMLAKMGCAIKIESLVNIGTTVIIDIPGIENVEIR